MRRFSQNSSSLQSGHSVTCSLRDWKYLSKAKTKVYFSTKIIKSPFPYLCVLITRKTFALVFFVKLLNGSLISKSLLKMFMNSISFYNVIKISFESHWVSKRFFKSCHNAKVYASIVNCEELPWEWTPASVIQNMQKHDWILSFLPSTTFRWEISDSTWIDKTMSNLGISVTHFETYLRKDLI